MKSFAIAVRKRRRHSGLASDDQGRPDRSNTVLRSHGTTRAIGCIQRTSTNRVHRPQPVTSLLAIIAVAKDAGFSEAYPSKSGCVIDISLSDSSTDRRSETVPRAIRPIRFRTPRSKTEFRRYFFFVQSPSEAGVVVERLWALDRQDGYPWLTSPLKPACWKGCRHAIPMEA